MATDTTTAPAQEIRLDVHSIEPIPQQDLDTTPSAQPWRRGGYLSSWMQFLMTMAWIGVNTYFPVVLAIAILGHFGVNDTFWIKFWVVTGIMIVQVAIGVYGFYLIRTFEKYTVPVVFGIM